MAHTYKTDPWHVKEARGESWHPSQFAREHSYYTKHRRDLGKRIRARERRFVSAMVGRVDWDELYKACDSECISGNGAQFINVRGVA